jgi:hypothetical protein
MVELGGFLFVLLIVGAIVLVVKALIALLIVPFKIGLGIVKLLLALLVGIPLLILGLVFAATVVPLLLVSIPILLLVLIVVVIVAAPFVLAFKCLF